MANEKTIHEKLETKSKLISVSLQKNLITLKSLSKENLENIKKAGFVLSGLISGGGFFKIFPYAFNTKNEAVNQIKISEPKKTLEEETSEDPEAICAILEAPLPVATNVNDEMSFVEAFANARDPMGCGALFQWRGKWFNTFYKEEWEELDPANREEYLELLQKYLLDVNIDIIPLRELPDHIENQKFNTEESQNNEDSITELDEHILENDIILPEDLNSDIIREDIGNAIPIHSSPITTTHVELVEDENLTNLLLRHKTDGMQLELDIILVDSNNDGFIYEADTSTSDSNIIDIEDMQIEDNDEEFIDENPDEEIINEDLNDTDDIDEIDIL